MSETCGVCWGSHECGLTPRHAGDHACGPDDPEPCEMCPRTGPIGYGEDYLYEVDLLRYDGEFCDICGPVERAPHINAVLDHAMRAHPKRWVDDGYADRFANYIGDGRWGLTPPSSGDVTTAG